METEKTGVVYRIYHKASMKSYIGKSVDPKKRIRTHLNGYSDSRILHNAIMKYGKDAFRVEILESDMPESQLSKLEILHIRFFNCKTPNGYNLTNGGEGTTGVAPWNKGKTGIYSDEMRQKMSENRKGTRHSQEARRKISEAGKGRRLSTEHKQKLLQSRTGTRHSQEARRKISEAGKGRTHSQEARRKISEAGKGRISGMKDKRHSPDTRRKMSEAGKGRVFSAEHCRKISEAKKGTRITPEQRRIISESNKGRTPWNKGKTGLHKHSPETRRKMSESHKRRNRSA